MTHVPTKFHWDILKNEGILTTTTTTITRGTVPRGTVDPIPNQLSLWPRKGFSRSLQVTATGALWKSIYNFLFNFNGNHGPICKGFQVTALRNMLDLDFDLLRSL